MVNGIASGHPIRIIGSVVLRLGLTEPRRNKNTKYKWVPVRFKVFGAGQSDWKGLILGARALDTKARGGLGFRVTDEHYVLESEGVVLPRLEEDKMPRQDEVYTCGVYAYRSPAPVTVQGRPGADAEASNKSIFDSDDEGEEKGAGFQIGAVAMTTSEDGDQLVYRGEDDLELEPGEGAWIPVKRTGTGYRPNGVQQEVVLQQDEACTDVAPGVWEPGMREGLVFVANTTNFDQRVETGAIVGVVAEAGVQTRWCTACGAADTEAWPHVVGSRKCDSCNGLRGGGKSSCRQCGARPEFTQAMAYTNCSECRGHADRSWPAETVRGRPGADAKNKGQRANEVRSQMAETVPVRPEVSAKSQAEQHVSSAKGPIQKMKEVPMKVAHGYAGKFLWKIAAMGMQLLMDKTRSPSVFHIVEQPGAVERMAEVEVPPQYYYTQLREDMEKRHPDADRHVLDHLESLEAFLDVSIVSGFSFGCEKAQVLQSEGKLLGRLVGRTGIRADGERSQAVRDFAPLKEKVHVQQFAGSTNWLRQHMKEPYAQALKVLGEYMKPGAVFPKEGLGVGNTPGDLAVKAIKVMACDMIELAVLDEAAAIDGSRPLEQIADSSGIAWGGTCLQMAQDLGRFNVLMTASKGLTPAQQAWPPLTLEGYAQLEMKRAQRRPCVREWVSADLSHYKTEWSPRRFGFAGQSTTRRLTLTLTQTLTLNITQTLVQTQTSSTATLTLNPDLNLT